MAGIFISYRRDDAQWPAARIFDRLASQFDASELFMDVDGIPFGVDFVEELGKRVGDCDALIAVVGKSWTSATDEDGRRRLDDPKDFVRIEIESALDRNIRVIPVLIDGARMPRATELPFSMKSFSQRHAVEVAHASFTSDMDRLCKTLPASVREPGRRRLPATNGQWMNGQWMNSNACEEIGGYSRESVATLEGRYLTLRPSFSPPGSIVAFCTEIRWDAGLCRLAFYELDRADKAYAHSGHVSAPHQADAIYLVTNLHGKMRLTMLGRPTIDGEMFGLLTTLKPERGSRYAPASCPIALVPESKVPVAMNYGPLEPGTREFIYAAEVLDRIVEDGYASFLPTPKGTPKGRMAMPMRKPRVVALRKPQSGDVGQRSA